MREPDPLQQVKRTYVRLAGRILSYFSGCDYFRLSMHSRVTRAARVGLERYGLSVSASRMTSGNHLLYVELECALAAFFKSESATLVPTGYLAGLAAAEALEGEFSQALMDERAHVALRNAAMALGCPVLTFRHGDSSDLQRLLRSCGPQPKPLVLTDGMFASDGSVAPLREYLEVLPRHGALMVDDAHAAGVLGAEGRGSLEHCGLRDQRIIQLITLSKAFGVYGGAVIGSAGLRQKIMARSRIFIGSTPLPLPLASAGLVAISILRREGKGFRARQAAHVKFVRAELRRFGIAAPDFPGPIVCLTARNKACVTEIATELLKKRVYPPFIKYPGGPAQGYFRLVISSEHTQGQMENLVVAVKSLAAKALLA